MYYAATNSYATETSVGFYNTWGVMAFETKKERDQFVKDATDLATKAITRREVPGYINPTPKPFSGEAYIIAKSFAEAFTDDEVLVVTVGCSNDVGYIRHLNA